MGYNITRAVNTADRQIRKFGAVPQNPTAIGYLRREGVQRPCTVAILEYSPREKGFVLEGARRALISALGLAIPPHHEYDMLVTVIPSQAFRIVAPVTGPRPGGIPIFYDCQVVYDSQSPPVDS